MSFAILVDLDGAGIRVADAARAAERAGFTAATFADRPLRTGAIDPIERAAFASQLTGAIGLIPVAQALYSEPFHLATQLASLDIAASGRAGWIVGDEADAALAARHGRAALEPGEIDEELAAVVDTARRLWDSWEDDVVIRDVATGRYLDRERLHYADVVTARFSVKGPAITPRPAQGQIVVFGAAGTSADVDAVLVEQVPDAPRGSSDPLVFLELPVALDPQGRASAALVEVLADLAGRVDGVRLLPAGDDFGTDLEELGRAVLPVLRERGLFVSPRAGDTLRASLGLPRPANRFAAAGIVTSSTSTEETAR